MQTSSSLGTVWRKQSTAKGAGSRCGDVPGPACLLSSESWYSLALDISRKITVGWGKGGGVLLWSVAISKVYRGGKGILFSGSLSYSMFSNIYCKVLTQIFKVPFLLIFRDSIRFSCTTNERRDLLYFDFTFHFFFPHASLWRMAWWINSCVHHRTWLVKSYLCHLALGQWLSTCGAWPHSQGSHIRNLAHQIFTIHNSSKMTVMK